MSMKHWLVVEGSKHGVSLVPCALDIIGAESAEAAAREYEKAHDDVDERLFVFPYEPQTFAVEVVVKPVSS
mgnify:CR=1 FL=1